MSGKRPLALLLAAALALTLTACAPVGEELPQESAPAESLSPTPVEQEETEFALGYAAGHSLHPLEATDRSNLDVAALVYEGLYQLDNTFTPQPVLARDSQVSEDGLVWTFTLDENAAFSDGTPLTAQHVVSSLLSARTSTVYGQRLSALSGVRAEEDRVVITLTAPNGNLPALLDVPILLQREDGLPLGTGPYAYDGEGDELWLAANPNWWQGQRPPFDRIPLRGVDGLDGRISAFDSGTVTAVTTDPNGADPLGYSSIYERYTYPTTDLLYVGFNIQTGPCADPLVRTALSRAFDRNSVTASLLGGFADAASLPVSPCSGEYDRTAAALLDFDLEGAAALLAEAGYSPDGQGLLHIGRDSLTLRFIVNQDSLVKQRIAQYLAEDLSKLGISVTVDALGWDDYMTALKSGDFDLYLAEVRLTGDFDLSALVTGSLNYGGYESDTVSALLAARAAAQGQDRLLAAQSLFTSLAEDLPFAALCFKRNSLLIRWGMVKNLAPVRGTPFAGVEEWDPS